ncbi:dihydroorotate dehydrogenase (quinone), partial [Salmonella enterica subsp. enterica serovar Enteritidis]|nr:dihydroorotate dehydrogenase (quinone) [Salmonella enterica subsp. enterica serovar Enteritidis]
MRRPFAMAYPLRSALFALDAERAHRAAIRALALWGSLGTVFRSEMVETPVQLGGLTFPNRLGLAAGLDKDAEAIPGLFGLGFGAVEVGTLTPRPQGGNPRPRLFRLPEDE